MSSFSIGARKIGRAFPVYFIAEVGVNHNGSLQIAKNLIREAKKAGADCVKFQTFKSEKIVTAHAPKANYQLRSTDAQESQLEMLKKLELSFQDYQVIIDYCDELGIDFLSTPYSLDDVDFLDQLDVKAFKIASGQIVEPLFLEYIAKKNKPIFLSTGMATLAEIDEAVRCIKNTGNDKICLLQCTTNYPSKIEDTNLRVLGTFCQSFDVVVGYSDHTIGQVAVLGSVALGASVVEKHLTLDKTMEGPDHSCSAEPQEIFDMIVGIREMEQALGTRIKQPTSSEIENAKGMRRSIVADVDIACGEMLSSKNIAFKRPASGLSPKLAEFVVGKTAVVDISANSLLTFDMFE